MFKKIEKLYNAEMLAEIIPLAKCTIAQKIRLGEFGEAIKAGRSRVVPESQVLEWMNKNISTYSTGEKYYIPKTRKKQVRRDLPEKLTVKFLDDYVLPERRTSQMN